MRRPASRSRSATCAPTPAQAGSSRSAGTCRRCPAMERIQPRSTSISTARPARRGSSDLGCPRPSEYAQAVTAVAETSASLGHAIDRSSDPLIRVEGVWKIFGRNAGRIIGTPDADLSRSELRDTQDCVAAVRNVSFEVWPREVFVVMGLSGSGKSTLVRTLIRLIEPTAGRVGVYGSHITAT